jgi:hypothetical protein
MINRVQYYFDREAFYRTQADSEPAMREQHLADADAWGRLADTANLFVLKHAEMRDWIASTFDR